jgi:NADPH:quinone reductase-like Zn-dependent oxidoreductase
VIGFSENRAAQAELVLVDVDNLTPKPKNVSWEVAGGLYVAGVTAWGAVHSVQLDKGETVVISGAAGGVGSLAAPHGIHAFIDTHGGGSVKLALALGVAIERIDTIADFAAAAKYGVKTEPGSKATPGAEVLAELERGHTHGKIVLRP